MSRVKFVQCQSVRSSADLCLIPVALHVASHFAVRRRTASVAKLFVTKALAGVLGASKSVASRLTCCLTTLVCHSTIHIAAKGERSFSNAVGVAAFIVPSLWFYRDRGTASWRGGRHSGSLSTNKHMLAPVDCSIVTPEGVKMVFASAVCCSTACAI